MSNILFISQNPDFKEDLQLQISRFLPDSSFVNDNPDIILIDEETILFNQLRAEYPSVPMVLLSSQSELINDNLNIVIKKPFKLVRLLDILSAANNRLDNSTDGYLVFNNYELRPNTREIVDLLTSDVTKLTEKEVSIIKYLYKSPDKYIGKSELQKDVWQYSEDVTTHTIETHIYRLRQKVEKENGRRLIITDNGGYKLEMN